MNLARCYRQAVRRSGRRSPEPVEPPLEQTDHVIRFLHYQLILALASGAPSEASVAAHGCAGVTVWSLHHRVPADRYAPCGTTTHRARPPPAEHRLHDRDADPIFLPMSRFLAAVTLALASMSGVVQQRMPANDIRGQAAELGALVRPAALQDRAKADGTPAPATGLTAAVAAYAGIIRTGDRETTFSVERLIESQAETWVVTETAQMPTGKSTDRTVLEKDSLRVRQRTVKQGAMEMDLIFTPTRATGTIVMSGSASPVDVALDGPIFADGAGAYDVLAALPLREGYSVSFRNLNAVARTVADHRLTVVGAETVSVPAGSFGTWKVEVSSNATGAGLTTLWVARESHQLVKTQTSFAAPRQTTITTELRR